MMRPTHPRRVNRMRIPGFDQSRFRPAVRTLLAPDNIVSLCNTYIPSGYSLRKRKDWEYFVLDERQQVAGLLRPIPVLPFPDTAGLGAVNVETFLNQQEAATSADFKSFVTLWHRSGVSVCTASASPPAEIASPLKDFYCGGKFDGIQSHKGANLMQHGVNANFFDAFFTHASTDYAENIATCQQFLKLGTHSGYQLFNHACRAYREDYQQHCALDPEDARWVEIQLGDSDVRSIMGGNTVNITSLQAFLRCGSLWMDTDLTKSKKAL